MKKYIIVLDIETTGLSELNCEITEIAAIKIDQQTSKVVDTFSFLINIDGDVPYFITNLTGITKYLLNSQGRNLKTVLQELVLFCNNSTIYAHNARFDKKFITYNLRKNFLTLENCEWVDTIGIFKKRWPNSPNYKLSTLVSSIIGETETHRALSDVKHTYKLLKMCI